MLLLINSALALVAVAVSGSQLAGSGAQSLQAQLDHVIQGWQTGWVADPPVGFGGPSPRPQMFRWRRNGAEITIEVREMADRRAALDDVDATPRLLSTGAVAAAGIGDRAYVASVPAGGSTVYVAVGGRVFTVSLQGPPDVAKSLAARVAPVVKASPPERS